MQKKQFKKDNERAIKKSHPLQITQRKQRDAPRQPSQEQGKRQRAVKRGKRHRTGKMPQNAKERGEQSSVSDFFLTKIFIPKRLYRLFSHCFVAQRLIMG
jgi:hypothetical protein